MASFHFATGFEEGNASGLGFSVTTTDTDLVNSGCYALRRSGPSQNVDKSITAASSLRISWQQAIGLQSTPAYQFVWRTATADLGKFTVEAMGVARWFIGSASVASANAFDWGLMRNGVFLAHTFDLRIGSSGWIEHWVDGRLAFAYSGSTGASPISVLRHRIDSTSYLYLDDYRIDLTDDEASPTGPLRPAYLARKPVDMGNYAQWWGSDGNAASNHLLVNEAQADASTYVIASAYDLRDSYVLPAASRGLDYSIAVLPTVVARKPADNTGIALFLESSGSIYDLSPSHSLTTSFATYRNRVETNPFTGSAWSACEIGAIHLGLRSAGSF